ncbi:hypothetical protein DE146DRAFT_606415 [Phaeosphaeria sp. MPI-PUGE-AT-0046c]|nr:hypothetical protein DE146DRAFT_606415 [Phaeosphaeria sp. MPI-PUGE-AT-0046c]
MANYDQVEIVLYDLACTKNICFSPAVWCIRLILNYKRIPYKTVFLEFPDIEPTLKDLGVETSSGKYTVPTIHHVPTGTYLMDSVPIAMFLEKTYPEPPLQLRSELGRQIEEKGRAVIGPVFRISIVPREINILSPRSQEYFRGTREAVLGCKLEDLLSEDKEEKAWKQIEDEAKEVGRLLLTNEAAGPFVLGAQPSATDFFIAGSIRAAKTVDEGVFSRIAAYPGFSQVYEACLPYMERVD